MIKKLQKKLALSRQGAIDLIKGCAACMLQNISFMFPVGLLYMLVDDLLNGRTVADRAGLYAAGCVLCILLIFFTTWLQYNATYFATYKESGVRRISLAEKLRKIPLAFFGQKDLSACLCTTGAWRWPLSGSRLSPLPSLHCHPEYRNS